MSSELPAAAVGSEPSEHSAPRRGALRGIGQFVAAALHVGPSGLEAVHLVAIDLAALVRRIDPVEPGGVEAKDLSLEVVGQLGVPVLLGELRVELEGAEGNNLRLRRARPDAVGPPEDVLSAAV